MIKQNKIDTVDKYLNNLFNKREAGVVPDDSFVTYLGNKLKFEFSRKYSKAPTPFFSWRLALATFAVLIVLVGVVYLSKTKTANQMADLDIALTKTTNELSFLDKEVKEASLEPEEEIDKELELVIKL